MRICDVLIEESFLNNQRLTYLCSDFDLAFGMRVLVKVRGRQMTAFVVKVYEGEVSDFSFSLESIVSQVDDEPIINEELYDIACHMAHTTVSPLIRCLQAILPNKLKPRATATKPRMTRYLFRTDKPVATVTDKQALLLQQFAKYGEMSYTDARKIYSGVATLIQNGYLVEGQRERSYQQQSISASDEVKPLTPDQSKVINQIELNKDRTYLLHGVTGSGKTEVYLQLAKKVLNEGNEVLFLVPEIALTPQMIERVSVRFGQDVAIYHSGLNDQEKYEQYIRIKEKKIQIVVGTRSAIFMPFNNLGLIVMDEEHDSSYKQTNVPMYHARDIALLRSKFYNCPLLLGSASPSLESYARALRGVYTLLEMPQRINQQFPKVRIIDTQKELYAGRSAVLSEPLKEAISLRLQRKEQTILLLNRRGYLPIMMDKSTGSVLMCPNCDVALSYHKSGNHLHCHVCDYQTHNTPKGQDGQPLELVGKGVGTQRLTEQLELQYPTARIARMDADSTTRKGAHEKILSAFQKGEIDILVGTQMIAKGLDVERVTLTGILNVDASLAREDYRSVETTFDLILQASGRSGRGEYDGEVMLQTFNAEHYAVIYAAKNQYKNFFKQEMQYRKLAGYPPYRYLIAIYFTDLKEENVLRAGARFSSLIDRSSMSILGPAAGRRLSRMHRARIILKGTDLEAMINAVHQALDSYRIVEKVGVSVDVNPLTLEE